MDAGVASRLRTLHETKESSSTSDATAKHLAHLVMLSRSTQERGLARLFQLSTPGSPSVIAATTPAMSLHLLQLWIAASMAPWKAWRVLGVVFLESYPCRRYSLRSRLPQSVKKLTWNIEGGM